MIFEISSLSCTQSYITVSVSSKKKSVSVPDKILKTSLFVFFKCYKDFKPDWSQTFAGCSSVSCSSLTIAPSRADEHSRCYESFKNPGFWPEISVFETKTSFLCKTKAIFGISSLSCIEPCTKKAFIWKKVFGLSTGKAHKTESYSIFRTLQTAPAQLSSNFQRILLQMWSIVNYSVE